MRTLFWLSILLGSQAFAAQRTLWLVRPLYPGQEVLVGRTEQALAKLMPVETRANEIIGGKELTAALRGKKVDEVPCFSGDTRCADPIDPFIAGLGFDRVVLIEGGQDEGGYKFRVSSYQPKTKELAPATSSNSVLEKALLGAVAKVVPVASTLEVRSTPPGATVYVDDVKVGVTPLSSQVLPGERVIRLDLKLHQPVEETLVIPVRGIAKLEKPLEKVAARIVISASPAGATIAVDGQVLGRDKIDRGILPGKHTLRLSADEHKTYEQAIEVKPDEQYVLDKSLELVGGGVDKRVSVQIQRLPEPPAAPAAPLSETELTYERKSYFQMAFEYAQLSGNALVGRRWGDAGTGRTERLTTPSRTLMGASAEYGTFGRYFGLTVVGVTYLTNTDPYEFGVGFAPGTHQETSDGVELPGSLPSAHLNLVHLRALHPQFRIAVWRFMFSLQAGLEFRTGQILGTGSPYKDGFMPLDLLAAVRANVRFFIVDGFFIYGSFNSTFFITGQDTDAGVRSVGSIGFNTGLGYAF